MGFHRRHISNDLIRNIFQQRGINALKDLLSADAFITERGLATDFITLINKNINERDRWHAVEELIIDNIYNKEMLIHDIQIPKAEIYRIVYDSEYSRDQKLIELKVYLSQFKKQLDAYGIEYTYMASQILTEYYAKVQRPTNNG